jgi:hypothetical protein
MIETLEARQFLSATPTSLTILRTDLARLGYPLGPLINTYVNVFNRLTVTMQVFKAPLVTGPLEHQLHVIFNQYLHTLAMDVTSVKLRMNQDAIQLAKAVALQARHPTNPAIAGLISADQAVLTSQANAGASTLTADSNRLIQTCAFAINQIDSAYPVDATPAAETLVLTNAISSATTQIESTMNQVANTDTPAYIAAIVPGSSTPA